MKITASVMNNSLVAKMKARIACLLIFCAIMTSNIRIYSYVIYFLIIKHILILSGP